MLKFHEALTEKISDAMSKVFNQAYPERLLQQAYVGPEFPLTREVLPSIIILYQPLKTQNMGLGNMIETTDESGAVFLAHQWRFEGQVQFEVSAFTTIDRAKITDQLTELLAYGYDITAFKPFWQEIWDNDFIALTFLSDSLNATGGASESPSPWDQDQLIYKTTLSVGVTGEFYSDPTTGGLIQVSGVDVYPYGLNQNPPQGTGDPNPWQT